MTDFPTTIHYMDAATFSEAHEDPAVPPSPMEGGYSISRPRFTRTPRRTFSWRFTNMSDTSKAAMVTFWNLVMGRSNSFNWTHPATGEVINVRFGEMKCVFKRIGFGPINIWESETVTVEEV